MTTQIKAQEYNACKNDPIYFIESFCILENHSTVQTLILTPAQKEIIQAINNNQFVSVMAARQFGKSVVGAAYILWFAMFHHVSTTGILGTNQTQSQESISIILEFYKNIPAFLKPLLLSSNKADIHFDNNSRITARSTNVNSFRGINFSLLFLDEFAWYSVNQDDFMTYVMPCLTATSGKCLIISTPNRKDDLFWFTHHNDTNFLSLTYTWKDMPFTSESWKQDQIAKLGYKNFYREYECRIDTINDLYAEIAKLKLLLP